MVRNRLSAASSARKKKRELEQMTAQVATSEFFKRIAGGLSVQSEQKSRLIEHHVESARLADLASEYHLSRQT